MCHTVARISNFKFILKSCRLNFDSLATAWPIDKRILIVRIYTFNVIRFKVRLHIGLSRFIILSGLFITRIKANNHN